MKPFARIPFVSYERSVPEALDAVAAGEALSGRDLILIKPNLVNASPFPVTSHPDCCAAILGYARDHAPSARLIVADGCGDPRSDTTALFDRLGFRDAAGRFGAELLDLNEAPTHRLDFPALSYFREIHLPRVLEGAFIISQPVLKAHSLAGYTGAIKNMMGVLPPLYYAQLHGFWRKAALHADLQRSLSELGRIVRPDLSLLDASVGLRDHHLGGRTCSPPVGVLLSGSDPYEVDRAGAELLGIDWRTIGHLSADS